MKDFNKLCRLGLVPTLNKRDEISITKKACHSFDKPFFWDLSALIKISKVTSNMLSYRHACVQAYLKGHLEAYVEAHMRALIKLPIFSMPSLIFSGDTVTKLKRNVFVSASFA